MSTIKFNNGVTAECDNLIKIIVMNIEGLKEHYHAILAQIVEQEDLSTRQIDKHPLIKKILELDEASEKLNALLSE